MFKNIALLVLVAGIGAFWISKQSDNKKNISQTKNSVSTISPNPLLTAPVIEKKTQESKAIFVPYWTLPVFDSAEVSEYDRLIYFGIAATRSGINKGDAGYLGLSQFVEAAAGKNTFLTLRMLDDSINTAVLNDPESQIKIINETLKLTTEYQFRGVLLDLEIVSPLDDKLSGQINEFVQKFYTATKDKNIKLTLAIYGDNYFRKRPFDVAFLSKHSDEIMIMAYEFHKSRGEPGPNFPLGGNEKYGYDFSQMIANFSKDTSPEKLTVAFGMFGYDWKVDEKKRPLKAAKALSLKDIKKEFLQNCQWKNCLVTRDPESAETEVNYVEEPYQLHIVWFEDEESVRVKGEALREKGIGKTAYWVYGYF